MAENQKHTNRLLKSNVKIDIKNREKAGATWALRNNRFCKGGDLQTSHEFKKLGTLRNQGAFLYPNSINQAVPKGAAFFISKIRLPVFVQTG